MIWLNASAAPDIGYRLIRDYPHSTHAFTEGLAIAGDRLIESDGLYGASRLRVTRLRSGQELASHTLPTGIFGEGVTVVGQHVVQLTWHARRGYVYDRNLKLLQTFDFNDEGWGLTYDGRRLIVSDGSDRLQFLDPQTYKPVGKPLSVHDGDEAVEQLNELEYANGLLYANVWHDSRIAVISPGDGTVLGWVDLSPLLRAITIPADADPREAVLNGIAYDPASGHFFVTGKDWPRLFEIAIDRVPGQTKAPAQPATVANPQ